MFKITEQEAKRIKTIVERERAIGKLIRRALSINTLLNNKQLLKEILEEYIRLDKLWWETMGEKYKFNPDDLHNVNWDTMEIT